MPIITYTILGITCLVSYLAFTDRGLFQRLIFNPYLINSEKQWYRFFSHALIHADFMHLAFNMITLYFFGPTIEAAYISIFGLLKGRLLFILLYVSAAMMSSVYSFEKHKHNSYYNAVGASGAISSVLYAWILIFPTKSLYIMLSIPIPGFIFGILYLFLSSYMAKRGGDNIGHDAHFWGSVYGVAFTAAFKLQLLSYFVLQVKEYFQTHF